MKKKMLVIPFLLLLASCGNQVEVEQPIVYNLSGYSNAYIYKTNGTQVLDMLYQKSNAVLSVYSDELVYECDYVSKHYVCTYDRNGYYYELTKITK